MRTNFHNKTFSNFTELVACIRNLISVCYIQRHILRRYFKYYLDDDVAQVALFHLKSGKSFEFLINSTKDLIKEFLAEATNELGLKCNSNPIDWMKLPDPLPKSHLPHNIDEEVIGDIDQPIIEIASVYLQAARAISDAGGVEEDSSDGIRKFVSKKLPEEHVRNLEAMVHGLQSKYDTYVKNTHVEQSNVMLLKLRGHISTVLHLLELTTGLVHFYERHENDIRSVEAKKRISRIVDKNEILQLSASYGYYFARYYIVRGQEYADLLLQEYSRIIKIELEMPDGVYLHARPVSLIVGIVQHHGTPVQMEIDGEKVEANSIIQVLMVSGQNPKTNRVCFYGDEKPLKDLEALFNARLGEDGLDGLPPSLTYLR